MLQRLLAFLLLVFLAPVFLFLILLLWAQGKGIWFHQVRSGRKGVPFTIYKFRTLQTDNKVFTPSGKWLRRYGLDELPQLFNILKGEMAFIGPRPLLPEYDAHYTETQRQRLEVLPGITGWAQVMEGSQPDWNQRLALDTWYVQNRSLRLDLKILRLTFQQKLRGQESPLMYRFDQDQNAGNR